MEFDSVDFCITKKQIKSLFSAYLNKSISYEDLKFICNIVILTGFRYDQETTEESLHHIANLSTEDVVYINKCVQEEHHSLSL